MTFKLTLPTEAPAALAAAQGQLARLRELGAADARLVDDTARRKASLDGLRTELDAIEGDRAAAEALDEQENSRKLSAAREAKHRQISEAEEALARNESGRRGIACRRDDLAAQIEATTAPGLQSAMSAIRLEAKLASRSAMIDGIWGKGVLIEAVAAATMLADTLGEPGGSFLAQLRIPDPLFSVIDLPTLTGAGGFALPGDDVKAHWLLRVSRGVILAGESVIGSGDGGEGPRLQRHEMTWRQSKDLLALAEMLMVYIAADREVKAVVRQLHERREREQHETREREREAATAKLPSYSGAEIRRGLATHVITR